MKITLVMAMTLDGKIARGSNDFANWTSKEDKKHFINITKKSDAIIMGMNTFKLFNKPLEGRLNIVIRKGRTEYKNNVWYYGGNYTKIKDWLEKKGIKKAILCGGSKTNAIFLIHKLVDDIYITIEPRLFSNGLGLCEGFVFTRYLKLLNIKKLNTDTILLHYKVLN